LQVNGLNGSLTDPLFMGSLKQLHACGLTKLDLEGDKMSGPLTDEWGELTQLEFLSLSEWGGVADEWGELAMKLVLEPE
jgi:hypothetical protein